MNSAYYLANVTFLILPDKKNTAKEQLPFRYFLLYELSLLSHIHCVVYVLNIIILLKFAKKFLYISFLLSSKFFRI